MPLRVNHVHASRSDVRIEIDIELPDGAVIGVTGPEPAELQLFGELLAGVVEPESGGVSGGRVDIAASTFGATEIGAVRRSFEATLQAAADFLVLGPALSLSGPLFRLHAAERIELARRAGAGVVLVSQDLDFLRRSADEVVVIEDGRITLRGEPISTLTDYRERLAARARQEAVPAQALDSFTRHGDCRAQLTRLDLLDGEGRSTSRVRSYEPVTVLVEVRFDTEVADPVVGILIRNRIGVTVYGTNTELEGLEFGPCRPGDEIELRFRFDCALCPHEYALTAASHDPDGTAHDWLEEALLFTVVDSRYTEGVANLRVNVSFERRS